MNFSGLSVFFPRRKPVSQISDWEDLEDWKTITTIGSLKSQIYEQELTKAVCVVDLDNTVWLQAFESKGMLIRYEDFYRWMERKHKEEERYSDDEFVSLSHSAAEAFPVRPVEEKTVDTVRWLRQNASNFFYLTARKSVYKEITWRQLTSPPFAQLHEGCSVDSEVRFSEGVSKVEALCALLREVCPEDSRFPEGTKVYFIDDSEPQISRVFAATNRILKEFNATLVCFLYEPILFGVVPEDRLSDERCEEIIEQIRPERGSVRPFFGEAPV